VVSTTRRNTSQRLTLVILILLSVTAITLQYKGDANKGITHVRNAVRDVLAPVQQVLSDVFRPIGDALSGAVNYSTVTHENAELRKEVGQLRQQVLENQSAQQQLQELLSEEHLPYVQNLPQLLGEVIAGSNSNYQDTFEINRGTNDGVGNGMPVVAGAGLVGIVVAAGPTTSEVQTIADPGSSFGVEIGSKGVMAVAEGRGPGYDLSVLGITNGATIHKGELVFTDGIRGSTLPAGIPVGRISSVVGTVHLLTKTVTLAPVASLSNLDFVTVLQWLPAA
jgi:rod shape-determining protein MreC